MKRNWLFWVPRILTILFILFVMMFSFDVFGEKAPWYRIMVGFLIHNIPCIIMAIFLWIAWKHPSIGAIFFFLVMIAFAAIVRTFGHIMTLVTFLIPPFLAGLLFLFDYFQQIRYKDELRYTPTITEPMNAEPDNAEPLPVEPEVVIPEPPVEEEEKQEPKEPLPPEAPEEPEEEK